jgi:hypothetical protein
MPSGMQRFEEVMDFRSMMPPPPTPFQAIPSTESGNTPLHWTPTPGYTPAPSQSQATPALSVVSSQGGGYRRLVPHEELGIVQMAIQHVHLRQPGNLKPFHEAVLQSFDEAYHWRYKSIPRKLTDMEGYWRNELIRRGSATGTENDGDLVQAMEAWIKLMDEENTVAADRAAAAAQDQSDRVVASRWRKDVVMRQRDRPTVVTHELPADQEFIDITDDEAPVPTVTRSASNTTAAPTTPVRSSSARGRGVSRTPRRHSRRNSSEGSTTSNVVRMFVQMEERRIAADERREAAIAAAEERREAREIAARERDAAIREREVANNTAIMQQISALVQHVIQRPQYHPQQRQLAPTSGGAFDENLGHPSGPTSSQPPGQFGWE